MATAPGWYGKLPTLGDFASRRLEPAFIEPWAAWLADGLAAQRSALGDAWVRAYLHSPAWRFVLMPGVIGQGRTGAAWGGVLMPSVDQVGRYFPLTLAARLATLPARVDEVEALLGWLQRLEDVAVDAMQDDWDIEQLEGVLATMAPDGRSGRAEDGAPAPDALADAIDAGAGFVDLAGVRNRSDLAAALVGALSHRAGPAWQQRAQGRSFWLADHPTQPRLLVRRGLPERTDVIEMLAGRSRDADATTLF
ncbi:MAG: type VI secretion system-associated protein TagF [Burkholderiaceae bacterium]